MSKLQEIKERLSKVKDNNSTNIVQKEHEDIEWLVNRMDQYIRVNIKLTDDCINLEDRVKVLEEAMSDIAFGYVEGDYADVRQYAREQL